MQTMTMSQLLELTIIRDCEKCGLKHALVRPCNEARFEVGIS